ncbi:hypothetical protein TPA0910_85210 [Streptomyces hygroscopicus subsp. sporocinereus]|uniref:Serine/threonine protein kinase n=2 Tax=Streptomyces hygroscopicus TaxID=1912 RepID=A0ABQ3UFV3_STRHY|nr:hypothetical protein TPA0910_85210 [Streptomyces hygroscopicus]
MSSPATGKRPSAPAIAAVVPPAARRSSEEDTLGAQALEFGESGTGVPSDVLVVGHLFRGAVVAVKRHETLWCERRPEATASGLSRR